MGAQHGIDEAALTAAEATAVARLMHALATSSRVRILARLRDGPANVGELVTAVGMEQPAVSQQLRVLRELGLVVADQQGRHVRYQLHDPHVAVLLDEARRHLRHLDPTASGDGSVDPAVDLAIDPSIHGHAHDHLHPDGTAHAHPHIDHDHDHGIDIGTGSS